MKISFAGAEIFVPGIIGISLGIEVADHAPGGTKHHRDDFPVMNFAKAAVSDLMIAHHAIIRQAIVGPRRGRFFRGK